jgi:hypothetical protein
MKLRELISKDRSTKHKGSVDQGVAEGLNEFAPDRFNGGDDSNDLQLYINIAKKLNMKKYKPSTAHALIAKKMAELVDTVDDDKVDYARHMARKAQGLSSMLDQKGVAEDWSTKYKRSIDCDNPKGFSQRAHCQGRKKHEESAGDRGDIPTGPGEQLIPFPAGTTMIDVSDAYDWYKLGMVISDLDDADPKIFGQGAPHTAIVFGSEEEEHKLLPLLKRLGLSVHDIDKPEDVKKAIPAKALIQRMEEDTSLEEGPSLPSTLKSITTNGEPIAQLYGRLKAMASRWMDNNGRLKGFHRNAAGQSAQWFNNFYFNNLQADLYALAKQAPKHAAPLLDFLKDASEDRENRINFTEISRSLPPILIRMGQKMGDEGLVRFATNWNARREDYESYLDSLEYQSDNDDTDEPVVKPEKNKISGQQNAQAEQIVNSVLAKLPKKISGEIRNAIARSPNKLQALHQELTKRNIQNVAEARGLAQVNPYVELMQSLGFFMSMNTAKIQQDAVDSAAQQELQSMQQQFSSPIINGKSFFEVINDPAMFKNPKVAPVLLKYSYDMLRYIEPRIKKYIRPELQPKWLDLLNKLKDKYRDAVQFASGQQNVAEDSDKCPPATQNIELNLENRQKAIDEYGYGPLNPDLPNRKFWMKKVDEWNLDSVDEAKQSLCGNCAAFDQRQETLDCIAQGIDKDNPQDAEATIDAGDLGYCKFLKFKCASRRTCDAWVTGGPLTDSTQVNESLINESKNKVESENKKEAVRRIQKMLNKKFNANLDIDGVLGPLTLKSINKFMPNAQFGPADEPDKTTAVQGKKIKNKDIEENFADGRNPQDRGDSARHGIRKGMSIAQLKKIRSSDSASARKKQLAHWQINMRQGKKK